MNESTQLDVIISLKDQLSGKIRGINTSLSTMNSTGNTLKGTFSNIGKRFGTEFSIISSVTKVATAGVGILAGGVVAMGVASIKAAADIETMKVALKTAMGGDSSAAGKAFDTIEQFAKKTPYQMDEVMRSFVKLKNMGLDPSEKALTSYGDTASAMGKSLNDMIEAVADAATGEFERLKEFGVRTSVEGDRVKFTFQGVTTEVGKNAKEIEDYLINLGETKFAGGMDDQSQTLIGRLSTLKDEFSITMATFATESGLMDVAKNAVNSLSDFINRNKDTFVRWGKEAIDVIRQKITAWVESMGGPEGIKQKMEDMKNTILNEVIPAVQNLIDKIISITSFIWEHRDAILAAVVAYEALKVAISIGEVAGASATAVRGLGAALGSGGLLATLGLVGVAIAIAIGWFVAIYYAFKNWLDQLPVAMAQWAVFKEWFMNLMATLGAWLFVKWEEIKLVFFGALETIRLWFIGFVEYMQGEFWRDLGFIIGAIIGLIIAMPFLIWDGIKNLYKVFADAFSAAYNYLKENVPRWIDTTVGWFNALPGRIWNGISSLGSTIGKAFSESWDSLKKNVPKWIDEVIKWFKDLPGEIGSALSNLGSTLVKKFEEAFKEVKKKISSFISGLSSGMKWALEQTGLKFADGGIVPNIVYASNGYFEPKGTDTIPAMLTPGEMVLNAGQQASLFRQLNGVGGKSISINITGDNYFSGEADENRLIDKIRMALSREQERADWGIS